LDLKYGLQGQVQDIALSIHDDASPTTTPINQPQARTSRKEQLDQILKLL